MATHRPPTTTSPSHPQPTPTPSPMAEQPPPHPTPCSNNSQTTELPTAAAAAADDKQISTESEQQSQPLPPQKYFDPEVLRPVMHGGKAWRQLQQDSEALRWHSLMVVRKMGGGPVSTAYLARDLQHRDERGEPLQVVIRVMDWSCVLGDYQRSMYPRLLKTYETLPQHPNIVRVLRRIEECHSNYLIQEWCALGSLRSALSPSGCFARGMAEGCARDILLQICNGLQFLHHLNIPHGRLTSSNVLLAKGFQVKLSDFGYPASSCSNCTDDDCHLRYRAPELLRGKPFTPFAADVWSVGIVLYEMLHVNLPYGPRDIANAERLINMPPLQFRTSLSFPGQMLVKRLLTFNPRFRPALETISSDPWMQEKSKNSDIPPDSCDSPPPPLFPTSPSPPPTAHPTADTPAAAATAAREKEKETEEKRANIQPSPQYREREERMEGRYSTSPPPPTPLNAAKASSANTTGPRTQAAPGGGAASDRGPEDADPTSARENLLDKHILPSAPVWQDAFARKLYNIRFEELPKEPWRRHRSPKGKRMTHRVASMFERYNPAPIPTLLPLRTAKKEPEPERPESFHVHKVRDQLTDFIWHSERMRMKFFRYCAGVIPPTCREFPLPPVNVISMGKKPAHFSFAL